MWTGVKPWHKLMSRVKEHLFDVQYTVSDVWVDAWNKLKPDSMIRDQLMPLVEQEIDEKINTLQETLAMYHRARSSSFLKDAVMRRLENG